MKSLTIIRTIEISPLACFSILIGFGCLILLIMWIIILIDVEHLKPKNNAKN